MPRSVRHTLDVQTRKLHLPVVDRTPLEPPPMLLAVVALPRVVKAPSSPAWLRAIRMYSRLTLTDVRDSHGGGGHESLKLCLEWYLGWTACYYHIETVYHVFRDVYIAKRNSSSLHPHTSYCTAL